MIKKAFIPVTVCFNLVHMCTCFVWILSWVNQYFASATHLSLFYTLLYIFSPCEHSKGGFAKGVKLDIHEKRRILRCRSRGASLKIKTSLPGWSKGQCRFTWRRIDPSSPDVFSQEATKGKVPEPLGLKCQRVFSTVDVNVASWEIHA